VRRVVLLALVLAACTGGGPTELGNEPVLKRPNMAGGPVTSVVLTPPTVASQVNDIDTVIGTAFKKGTACLSCAITFKSLDTTKAVIQSTFVVAGGTAIRGAVVKSLAVGTARIRGGNNSLADTTVFTITATEPPPPDTTGVQADEAEDFVGSISVQLHLGQGGIYDQFGTIVKPRLLELGVRHVRERMFDNATTQSQQQELAAAGIKLTAGCWPENGNFTDASRCIELANAYGVGAIDAFDGWNEVNGQPGLADWKTAWVQWQQAMWNAYGADATWSGLPVLANSFTSTAATTELFTAKGSQSSRVDAGNMHDYPGGGNTPEGSVEDAWVNANTQLFPGKPLWTTETGYHTCTGAVGNTGACGGIGVNELAQAKYTGRIFAEHWRRGSPRTNLYQLMDEGPTCGSAGTDREDCWGLVRFDGSVKPSFTTVKSMIAILGDAGGSFAPGKLDYTLTNAATTTKSILLQKRDGRFYLVIWQALKVYDQNAETNITNADDQLTVTLPSSRAWKTYKPIDGTGVVNFGTGSSFSVAVPDHVLIIEIAA
jgi:hypothetical protein